MRRVLTAFVVGLLAALGASLPAAAHGDEILQLGAERIQPGGSIEVRGDLGSGEAFAVALVSQVDGTRRLIATIPATEEGHFQSYVTIPADVTAGEYLLEVAVDEDVIRAPLTIAGSPLGGDGGTRPEQDEGLPPPLPSGFGGDGGEGAAAGPRSSAGSGPADVTASPRAESWLLGGAAVPALGILAAIVALGVLRRAGRGRT